MKNNQVGAMILMAIFKSTAFSRSRKSFGNLTTSIHKGQNIYREKVVDVYNPRTLPQRKQRKNFPALVKLSQVFGEAIARGLKGCKEQKHTVENYFIRLNKGVVTVNDDLEVEIDYARIQLSKGSRAMPEEYSVTLEPDARQINVTFEAEEFTRHAADDDEFYCCVLEKTRRQAKLFELGSRKSVTSETPLSLPSKWDVAAGNLAIYLFCTSKDQRMGSETVYVDAGNL